MITNIIIHYSSRCGYCYKAGEINNEFVDFLTEFGLSNTVAELLKETILEEYADNTASIRKKKGLVKQLTSS